MKAMQITFDETLLGPSISDDRGGRGPIRFQAPILGGPDLVLSATASQIAGAETQTASIDVIEWKAVDTPTTTGIALEETLGSSPWSLAIRRPASSMPRIPTR